MIRRVCAAFNWYANANLQISLNRKTLRNEFGDIIGVLDVVELREGRLVVEGWSTGSRLGLFLGDAQANTLPSFARSDVNTSLGIDASEKLGFVLDISYAPGEPTFMIESEGKSYFFELPQISRVRGMLARVYCAPKFVGLVGLSLPDLVSWKLSRNTAAKTRIKSRFNINISNKHYPVLSAIHGQVDREFKEASISIVLPVYNAFSLLPEVLERVVKHTKNEWHLIIIEDCSSDPDVRPWLQKWVKEQDQSRITLLLNNENLGFILSVNKAFGQALRRNDHVVLLNSDAFLPEDWDARLIQPILDDPDVASVTPMSNDAEIFNVPTICQPHGLISGYVDKLDAVAKKLNDPEVLVEVPTGVGFCMAMNIEAIKDVPEFDTVFGRGYGEEVDWCQKQRALGRHHIGHGGLFVEHRGGQSFGSEAKQRLIAKNNGRVLSRYPKYDMQVQDFIDTDPLICSRLTLALAWANLTAASSKENASVPIFIAHDMGGGAEIWLQNKIADLMKSIGTAVVIRTSGVFRWRIEVYSPTGITSGCTSENDILLDYLGQLNKRRVVYSCGVGDGDPIKLPEVMLTLAEGEKHTLEVLIHDFFPVSPSYTLLDDDGLFHGVPDITTTNYAHQCNRPDGSIATLEEWRLEWGKLLERANIIRTFSEDSRNHIVTAYPAVSTKVEITPHELPHVIPEITLRKTSDKKVVVGVLGNIGFHKGADILLKISDRISNDPTKQLVVVGNVDPSYALHATSITHGDYKPEDIPGLVERYGISRWFIPSICPETFSYTTHEALASKIPVWAFDLGAQGAAVKNETDANKNAGGVIPLRDAQGDVDVIINAIFGGQGVEGL